MTTEAVETLHRRRRRKSSRQRGMFKVLHNNEGTEVPMFSRAAWSKVLMYSGATEVLVVSGHQKSSRLGAHCYVNLSRSAGIVDRIAVGSRIPSSCKPPPRRISVATFTQGSCAHWDLNGCRWI